MEQSNLGNNTIGKHLTDKVPIASGNDQAGDVKRKVFGEIRNLETINYVYVVEKSKLVGVVSIKELVDVQKKVSLEKIMTTDLITVRAGTHREKAVYLALEHSLKALPVVDKKGNFLGAVPSDALLEILHSEANQDLFYLMGSSKSVVKEPIMKQVKLRLPWILVGLFGGIVSSSVIAHYESTLLQLVRLAAFIPVILNISGNVATQSAVLFVREVSLGKVEKIFRAIGHEIATGALIGVISGLLLGLVAAIGHGSVMLGVIVGVSIVFTQTVAAILGLLIPWLFKLAGKDPAMGSGPVVTTLMDIVAVSVYLTVAWGLLS